MIEVKGYTSSICYTLTASVNIMTPHTNKSSSVLKVDVIIMFIIRQVERSSKGANLLTESDNREVERNGSSKMVY